MKDFADEQVAAAGVKGNLRLEDLLFAAGKACRIAPLQIVRSESVVGEAHLRSAALHAQRAFDQGRNHAERPEVEFLRYLTGQRQIKRALARAGVRDGATSAVVVALGEKRLDALRYFLDYLGLAQDDALLAATPAKLAAFGISDEAMEATTEARRYDLVLEAVAAVDLLR